MTDTHIGYVRINTPFEHVNASFECAAWWEESEAVPGIYPVMVAEKQTYYNRDMAYAMVDHVVTRSYFPAMFGGVSYGGGIDKNVGQTRQIALPIDIIAAILATGNGASATKDFFIFRSYAESFVSHCKFEVESYVSTIANADLDSNLHMVSYYGQNLAKYAKAVDDITRHFGYDDESNYFRTIHAKNTEWVPMA